MECLRGRDSAHGIFKKKCLLRCAVGIKQLDE